MFSTIDYENVLNEVFNLLEFNYPLYKWEMISKLYPPYLKNEKEKYGRPYITTLTIPNDIEITISTVLISYSCQEVRYVIGHNDGICYGYLYCRNTTEFIKYLKEKLPNNYYQQLTLI